MIRATLIIISIGISLVIYLTKLETPSSNELFWNSVGLTLEDN